MNTILDLPTKKLVEVGKELHYKQVNRVATLDDRVKFRIVVKELRKRGFRAITRTATLRIKTIKIRTNVN